MPSPLPPTATHVPTLQDVVQAVASRHSGTMGFYVKDLRTGATATLNADQKLRSASLYKLWVLNSAFARVQAG